MSKRIQQISNQKFGHLIKADRQIEFTLNKKRFTACFGDTLYSALIANGIFEVEGPNGESLSLSKSLPLFARHQTETSAHAKVLISDLVIQNGDNLELDMSRINLLPRLMRLARGQRHAPIALNWSQNVHFDLPHASSLTQKIVVIGGGIAGMQAALEAAKSGKKVLLLEKDQLLGGMCAYYGKSADETEPEDLINTLIVEVEAKENIRIFTSSKALDIKEKSILVQHSLFHEERQRTELSWVNFDQMVIATGGEHNGFTLDNHLPHRVLDSKEVFHDLWAYGLNRFQQNLLYTVENGAYRLAMHMKEAGLDLIKAYDGRPAPSSRHIDFAKAVGVQMGFALRLQSAVPLAKRIQCHFSPTHMDAAHQHFQTESDALIVGYPPQPDNGFWVKAGGSCALDERSGRIMPDAGPDHIAIVGTAAGYSSQIDCLTSVAEAMSQLGQRGLTRGASQGHNSQVYESPAAYKHNLPDNIGRNNTRFYDYPKATNYYLKALPHTDQTLRQYFANGYFADTHELTNLPATVPAHIKSTIPNAQEFLIHPQNNERLRVGQKIFVAGQDKSDGAIGTIITIEQGKIVAICNGDLVSTGLKISVERRNGLNSPATIGETL